jgi:predicted DNA-binding ArsR family transcriptional regulator
MIVDQVFAIPSHGAMTRWGIYHKNYTKEQINVMIPLEDGNNVFKENL